VQIGTDPDQEDDCMQTNGLGRSRSMVAPADALTATSSCAALTAEQQELLRRVALHDDELIRSLLVDGSGEVGVTGLDPKSCALVRLGVLIALDAPVASYQWGTQQAMVCGATVDEIVGMLRAVVPVAGVARVVAAAPRLALALGYDIHCAFETMDDPFD
jgi:alkylhydroperoxidase/carboxymuconolactone decarboxylase family protein YurZ